MKKLLLIGFLTFFGSTMAQANLSKQAAINACVTELTQKNMADQTSANQSCQCYINTLSGITDKQKQQIDTWVKSGKPLETSPVYQKLTQRLVNCGKQ